MPSNAFVVTSCTIADACASRFAAVESIVCTAVASKVWLMTFCTVGMIALPVIAARHVGFSAFQFFAIVVSAFHEYHTGFDSLSVPTFACIEASAFASHGGIHAEMR